MEEIKVSICCITYNHEKYIGDALESFLMQETDFKFEIIVHDDASTDQTPQIIKEYAEKYPDIIVPILQTENQYSRGVKVSASFVWPQIRGEYMAVCEGDDFWCDAYKLQEQFEQMEKNKRLAFCCHANKEYDDNSKVYLESKSTKLHGVFNLKEYLEIYYSQAPRTLFHTSSLFVRTCYVKELLLQYPNFYFQCSIGDIPFRLFLLTCGEGVYIDKNMSVYRRFTASSWSNDVYSNKKKLISHYENMIEMYKAFDIYTKYANEKIINKFIDFYKFKMYFQQEKYRKIVRFSYARYLLKLPIKSIIYVLIHAIKQ
ncbi:MAG: glycosyltransferase family 2 protein [Clostridiales bacterium]|nr:glycosyltransferase family 2 protein [Clostridiales bacterium]